MFNFKKSLIFSIALIVVGLVPFIISTNSVEAKMQKEPTIQGGETNAFTQPAGNYDDRVDSNEEGVEPKPEPKPEPEPIWGDTVVKPADVKPPPPDWEE